MFVCYKARPSPLTQQIGDLPVVRVNPSKPFANSGVDYAEPFEIKDGKTRSRKFVKGCVCVFVSLVSNAYHLELVPIESFLNTFKRFVSKRAPTYFQMMPLIFWEQIES